MEWARHKNYLWADVVRWFKSLLLAVASHILMLLQDLATLLPMHLPTSVLGKRVNGCLSTRVPVHSYGRDV